MAFCEGKDHADLYAKSRPGYPEELYEILDNYCKEGGTQNTLAVDVGCGTGHGTVKLSGYYDHIIGLDLSQFLLDYALKTQKNVTYRLGPAEDLSFLSDSSVDLITAATCFHYFDHPVFFEEVRRVLKPKGVLSIYAYGYPTIKDCPEAIDFYLKMHKNELKEYYTQFYSLMDNKYKDILIPFNDVTRVEVACCHEKEVTFTDIFNLIKSFTPIQRYLKANPVHHPILQKIEKGLKDILNTCFPDKTGPESKYIMHHSYFIIMARNRSLHGNNAVKQ